MKITATQQEGGRRVVLNVHDGGTPLAVTYSSSDAVLVPSGEAAVAGFLLVAMARGQSLCVEPPIERSYREHLHTIQDIYLRWEPKLTRIEVHEDGRKEEGGVQEKRGVLHSERIGAFFSGGVDSFYTVLKHQDNLDALVYVHGFDVDLDDTALRSIVSSRLRKAAQAYGKRFIEVETNLRQHIDRACTTPKAVTWELVHGASLASVAHVLRGELDQLFVPSSLPYDRLYPWGSHPILDPLWSSAHMEIVYDGSEANRMDKVLRIAHDDVALRSLRVCWKNPEGAYNCGQCEKCIRTMLMLEAAGCLDRCTTFNEALTPRRVRKLRLKKAREVYYHMVLDRMREVDGSAAMVDAVETALRRSAWYRRTKRLRQRAKKIFNHVRSAMTQR